MRDWKVTVRIGSRVTTWTFPAISRDAARKHAELQLRHMPGKGSVIKVEEA
jgi:hypothetical protein